jgi:hypothetical protein
MGFFSLRVAVLLYVNVNVKQNRHAQGEKAHGCPNLQHQ